VLTEADGALQVSVPKQEEERISCYRLYLPVEIMRLFDIQDGAAERQIYRILNEADMEAEEIMRQEDIRAVPWLERPPPLTPKPACNLRRSPSIERDLLPWLGSPVDSSQPIGSDEEVSETDSIALQVSHGPRRTPALPASVPRQNIATYDERSYRWLLGRVVDQAKRAAMVDAAEDPSASLEWMNAQLAQMNLASSTSSDPEFSAIFGDSTTLTTKMGAAGELFVWISRIARTSTSMARILTVCRCSSISVQALCQNSLAGIGEAESGLKFESCLSSKNYRTGKQLRYLIS